MGEVNSGNENGQGRNHPDFIPHYIHIDRETEELFSSPFPVAVFCIHRECFGVGNVIGSIDNNPVIEVQDRDSGEPICVMGYELFWTCPVPEEVIDGMARGDIAIDSIIEYRQKLSEYTESTRIEDEGFLDENGIDPESL